MDINSENEWFGMAADQATGAAKHFENVCRQFNEIIETWKANPPYPMSLSTFTKLVAAHAAIQKALGVRRQDTEDKTLDDLNSYCRDVLNWFAVPVIYKYTDWEGHDDKAGYELLTENIWQQLGVQTKIGQVITYGEQGSQYVIGYLDDSNPEGREVWLIEFQYLDTTK